MFYKVIRKIVRPITNFLWPVKIINLNKFEECQGVYVCNHYSMLDPVPFVTELFEENFNVLMKEEVMKVPILGEILIKIGAIPVKRGTADLRAVKNCLNVLKNGEPLILFPEGTRNKTDNQDPLDFKDGAIMFAFKTKSPIIPMLYDRQIKTFRRTYLIIGEPIYLDEFYGENLRDIRGLVNDKIRLQMDDMRLQMDSLLKDKKALKLLLKEQKLEVKQIKKQKKLDYKQKQSLPAPKE
ncbi:MAG: 1-acyl-sn-glycerol-3-phosphate acyltransferase [Clostridia bacterium]|nr:1-acyl-sn-glycerol-3-phosphate acyltransferase [Clostridia bacterium]